MSAPGGDEAENRDLANARAGLRGHAAVCGAVGGVLCISASVAGYLSVTGLAVLDMFLDIASFFRLQLLIASIACAALLCMDLKRRRLWLVFPAVALVINAGEVLPWHAEGEATPCSGPRLVVCVANVLRPSRQRDAFVPFVRRLNPDVLAVLETNAAWEEALEPLRDTYPYVVKQPDRHTNYGMLLFSRLPPAASAPERPGLGLPRCRRVDVEWEGRAVRIIAAHPFPPADPARFRLRNLQLRTIGRSIRGTDVPALVIGDLNTPMFSRYYKGMVEEGGLMNSRQGRGLLATCPSALPSFLRIPLDHILHSPHFRTCDCTVLPIPGSDHMALVAELAWRGDRSSAGE